MNKREFIKHNAILLMATWATRVLAPDNTIPEKRFEPLSEDERLRLVELDVFWHELERSVREGDFEAYRAACHELGVLVRGVAKSTQPLTQALEKWKQGFLDTKDGKTKARVEIRLSQRLGDKTTAHETGIFHYSTESVDGRRSDEFVHFEALLVKTDRWKTMMEYQRSPATSAEWNRLNAIR